jgi:glycosyltransferase involved in cell wall biosynthesis
MPSVSFVIPAYNEEQALPAIALRSLAALRENCEDYELLILNDGSSDQTAAVMHQIYDTDPAHVRLLTHEVNQGIARTLEDLYAAASKEYVFDIAGDGQYPPEVLKQIIPLLSQYDIVVCNRVFKHYTPYRKLISFCYRWMPRILFGVDLYDSGSTKCRKKSIITDIHVTSKGVFVEAERLIRAVKRGYSITKIDMVQEARQGGKARGARLPMVLQAIADLASVWFRLQILRQKP